jgi:uncharacterized SAM-binding protein YcdF (DUF218 family)
MLFILSKTVASLLLPSTLLLLLALTGFVLMWTRWRRAGIRLGVTSVVLLAVVAFFPVGTSLIYALEHRFPPWDAGKGAPDGIVVLGGAIVPSLSRAYGTPVVNDAGRILAIGQLARAYPKARIIYTGGDPTLSGRGTAETLYLAPVLDILGLPRERVELESRSRNTVENAVFTKALTQPKRGERWLLVTTAWHMPRAVGCFRQAGFPVEAYPVGWTTGRQFGFMPSLNAGGRLGRLDLAVHEWMGLIAYRLLGRTDAVFPAP